MNRPIRRVIDIVREEQDLMRRHRGLKAVDPNDIVSVIPDDTPPEAEFRVVETTLLRWQGQTIRMNAGSTFRVRDYGRSTVQVWVHARLLKVTRVPAQPEMDSVTSATESPREGPEGGTVGVSLSANVEGREDGFPNAEVPIPQETSNPVPDRGLKGKLAGKFRKRR